MAGITCFRRNVEAQSRDVACYVSTAKFRIPARILLLLTVFIVSAKSAPQWRVQFEPTRIVNGSPVLFRVTAPTAVKELTGNFLGQEINFRRSSSCRCWYAISGVSLNTKPGRYKLHLADKGAATNPGFDIAITVLAAHYPSSIIKVAPAFVEPPKEMQPLVEAADSAKKQAFSVSNPDPLWS